MIWFMWRSSLTIFVSLLVPVGVRTSVLWLLLLLLSALVEHLLEELELRRDWEDKDQQSADQRLEQHCSVLLFSRIVVYTIGSVVLMSSASDTASCPSTRTSGIHNLGTSSPLPLFLRKFERAPGSCERKIARDPTSKSPTNDRTTPQPNISNPPKLPPLCI
jgi:hypothetical protein